MPLPFHSMSHQTIAFGFFQIEVDMLLLERRLFFADQFCDAVVHLARGQSASTSMHGYVIADAGKVGNVNGAIAGWDRSGFIGATYERFPFPSDRAAFKQETNGACHRDWARELMADYGAAAMIPVCSNPDTVTIGDIVFSHRIYKELIGYVVTGGYPRWRDENPPQYVVAMTDELGRLAG